MDASYALLFSDYERLGAGMGLATVPEAIQESFQPRKTAPTASSVQPVVTKSQNDQAIAELMGMMKQVKKR